MMEENNETRVEWGEAQGGRREMVRVGNSRVKGLRDFLREKEEAERSRKQQSAALTLHHHYEQHELHFLLALNHYHLRHALRHIEAQIESPFTSQIQTHHHLISVLPTPQPRAYRVAVGGLNATEGGREAGVRLDFERSSIWVGDEQFQICEFLQEEGNMRKMAAVHADPSSCGEDKMVEMAMTIFKGIVMDYFSRREVALLVKSVPNCPATAPTPPPAPSLALSATSSNFQHLLGNFLRANRSQQSTYFVGCEEGLAFLVYLCEGQNCVKLFKKRSRYEDNWLADMAEAELLKGRGLRSGGSQEGSRVMVMNVGQKRVGERDLLEAAREDVGGLMRGVHRDKLVLLLQRASQMT